MTPRLSVTSWNTAGVSESGLSCFIRQTGDCISWHVVCLHEAFKRLENLEIPGGHVVYTPSHRPQRGFRVGEGRHGGRHGDLRFWGTLGGCESVVARRVDHQCGFAACTTERYVL